MPTTESEKILERIRPILEAKSVLDLGCGIQTVVPWAVGVDDGSETVHLKPNIVRAPIGKSGAAKLSAALRGAKFAVVFSSHALEHMREPVRETLEHWSSFVAPGGALVLYLPEERAYRFDPRNPKARNPSHWHYLTMDTFVWYAEQLPNFTIDVLEHDLGPDRYSFLCILRRK